MKNRFIQQSFELAIKNISFARAVGWFMLCILATPFTVRSQMFEKVEQLRFGGGPVPITVEVTRTGDTFSFFAVNGTQFLYEVEIKFNEFYNLRPQLGVQTITAKPGRNTLFNVEIVNKTVAPRYTYSTRYRLSPELATTADEKYPYLFPLKKETSVKLFRVGVDSARILGVFASTKGDTVLAMRKGVITATPDFSLECTRLTQGSVEILHPDGTVAIYYDLIPGSLCKYGDRVLPGRPLGTLPEGKPLMVRVVRYTEHYNFRTFNYLFATGDRETVPSTQLNEGWKVVHPVPVVVRELSKREAKRLVP